MGAGIGLEHIPFDFGLGIGSIYDYTIDINSLTVNKTAVPVSVDVFKAFSIEIEVGETISYATIMIKGISYTLEDKGNNIWTTRRRIPCMQIGADANAYDIHIFVGKTGQSGFATYPDALTITNTGSGYITDKYNHILDRFKELAMVQASEYFDEINGWYIGYNLGSVKDSDFPVFHIPRLRNTITPRSAGSRKSGTVTNTIILEMVIYDKSATGDYARINRLAEKVEAFFNRYRSLDSFYGIRIAKVTDLEIEFNSESLVGGGAYELKCFVYIDFPSIRGYIEQ